MPRTRHRCLAVLLGVGTVLAAGACSGRPGASTKSPKVAIVIANTQLSFSKEMAAGFRAGVNQVGGVQVEVAGPEIVDGPAQLKMFQAAARSSPDGVSLFTLNPELFIAALTTATGRGLPVIAVDNPAPPGAGVDLFVGNDNVELGQKLADSVIDRLPADAHGTIVLGTSSPGSTVLDGRAAGIRMEITKRLPRVRVLGPFDTKQEISANLTAWGTLVKANPKALAFFGSGDADSWNLAAVRSRTHGRWLAAGFDLDPKSLAAVKAGGLVLMSPEHFLKGALAGRLQAATAKGSKLPQGWVYVPGLLVTPDNIDAVISRQMSATSKELALRPQTDAILSQLAQHLRSLDDVG